MIEECPVDDLAMSFLRLLWSQLHERRVFMLDNMILGKGWKPISSGGLVCVIFGCDVPLVLRPVGSHYELIGDCYVEGIMEGEAMEGEAMESEAMEAVYDYSVEVEEMEAEVYKTEAVNEDNSEVDEMEALNDNGSEAEATSALEDKLREEDVMTFDLY